MRVSIEETFLFFDAPFVGGDCKADFIFAAVALCLSAKVFARGRGESSTIFGGTPIRGGCWITCSGEPSGSACGIRPGAESFTAEFSFSIFMA